MKTFICGPLFVGLLCSLPGCVLTSPDSEGTIEYQGAILTEEQNNNGVLESGETTRPDVDVTCVMKPSCSDDIYVEWTICLVEKFVEGGVPQEMISLDLNGAEMCARFRTDYACEGGQLGPGTTLCLEGYYCTVSISAVASPMDCGWRVVDGQVYNSDGSLIEGLSIEKLQSFGYELLPVEMSTP